MDKKIRLHILTLDITLIGGVERMISVVAPGINGDAQYGVEIISLFNSHNKQRFDFGEIKITYLSNTTFSLKSKLATVWSYFNLFKSLLFLQTNKNDIYISTFPNISIFFLLLKGNQNLIVSEHSQFNAHNRLANKFRKYLYKQAKIITVLTPQQKKIFDEFCDPQKVYILPNPINQPAESRVHERNQILAIGRLVTVKGFNYFIDAIKIIISNTILVDSIILGSGPEKENLRKLIEEKEISNSLKIIEGETDVFKYLAHASVLVVTSSSESFGMAILEALSVGVPVVSFDAGDGPKNLIIDGVNGYLVPFGDTKELSNKIQELINSPNWSKFSVAAKMSARQYYIAEVVKKWIPILELIKQN